MVILTKRTEVIFNNYNTGEVFLPLNFKKIKMKKLNLHNIEMLTRQIVTDYIFQQDNVNNEQIDNIIKTIEKAFEDIIKSCEKENK